MQRVVVHIGLPKTGTTTLQRVLFENHPELTYFGQTNIWTSENSKVILKALLTGKSMEKARNLLLKIEETAKKILISDEAFTLGEFMLRAPLWNLQTNHKINAARIKYFFNDTEIIIILRNQGDWLESWYKQGLKSGKYLSQSINNWLFKELDDEKRMHLFTLLDYEKLYNVYADTFGREHTHVFLYEDYCSEFHKLASCLAEIIGVNAKLAEELVLNKAWNVTDDTYTSAPLDLKNIARSKYGRAIVNYAPRLTALIRNMLSYKRSYPVVTQDEKRSVMEYFYDSNKRLLEQLNKTCEKYLTRC